MAIGWCEEVKVAQAAPLSPLSDGGADGGGTPSSPSGISSVAGLPTPPPALVNLWNMAATARQPVFVKHSSTGEAYDALISPLRERATFLLHLPLDSDADEMPPPMGPLTHEMTEPGTSAPNSSAKRRWRKLTRVLKTASKFKALARFRRRILAKAEDDKKVGHEFMA